MTKALYILAEMSDRDLEWIATSGRQRKIAPETILMKQGEERTDALYIVLEGSFSVQIETLDGPTELATLSPGDIIGEMSFIDSRPPSATVKAKIQSLVWAIPWTKLSSKLLLDSSFAAHFYHATSLALSDRMRRIISQIEVGRIQSLGPDTELDLSPSVMNRIELVEARFEFLLKRLKEINY